MNIPPDSTLPFRKRESTFRLYEKYINAALENSPEPVFINPAPLRSTTFSARLRDAIIAYREFKWPAMFTYETFIQAYDDGLLTVTQSENYVVIGPMKRRGRLAGELLHKPLSSKQSISFYITEKLKNDELHAFCLLLSRKHISGPVMLLNQTIDREVEADLLTHYDVAITNEVDGTILI